MFRHRIHNPVVGLSDGAWRPRRRWCRLHGLGVAALLAISGCVMVPVPATLDEVEVPLAREELLMAPAGRVALLGALDLPDDDENLECVRDDMAEAAGASAPLLLSAHDFRQWFHPWFDPVRRPRSLEELATVLRDPVLRERIELHSLRYLATVRVHTTESELEGPVVPHLLGGVGTYDRHSDLTAALWDLKTGESAGEVHVSASGGGGFVGYGFYGMWMIPRTESAACHALGQALGALFTGGELPSTNDSVTPPPDAFEPDRDRAR